MDNLAPTVDATFRSYANLLFERHQTLLSGKADAAEIQLYDEVLSEERGKLDAVQRQCVDGLAGDLDWVRRQGAPPPTGRRAEDVTEGEKRLLADAETRGDWYAVLHYLRLCAPAIANQDLAHRRATAYAGVGFPAYEEACRGLAPAPAVPMTPHMQYESNPKHSEPWQSGKKGSLCPKHMKPLASKLLAESEQVGKQRFAYHEGGAYCAREHREGIWHGYPVGWKEVPAELRNQWKRAGKVTKREIDRNWEGDS